MSQFACPVCGKNSSIKLYDPDELEQDLKVVTYGSTGRGGIYVADKTSILGQGDPIEQAIAGRTLKVIKMFLETGSLKKEQLRKELGISEKANAQEPPNETRTMNFVLNVEDRFELEQYRKQRAEEKEITKSLLEISKLCSCEFHLTDELNLTMQIIDTIKHDLELIEYFEAMGKSKRDNVLRRINSKDPEIQSLLEVLASIPKRKDFMEHLIESDFMREYKVKSKHIKHHES